MKLIIAFIIFALAFSGYSAASHAMGAESCSSLSQVQDDNCVSDVQNSSDHSQKYDQSAKEICLDCCHCCTASILVPLTSDWEFMSEFSNLNSALEQFKPENRLFSILRPPRTLA